MESEDMIVIEADDIIKAQARLKFDKTAGQDGLMSESLRLITDPRLLTEIAKLFSELINNPTSIPIGWKRGMVHLVAKVFHNPAIGDYRPITLLSHMAKFFEHAVFI
jgi:hypothetical protein